MVARHSPPSIGDKSAAQSVSTPIDFGHLARYTLGDKALEHEVLQLFVAEVPVTLGRLRSADTDSAWRMAAHTIKGSARAVGAWKVAALAEEAERAAAEERRRMIMRLHGALEEVVRFVMSLVAPKV
jgi:HPt (histidine-containing phosphotransfer) domain-containing protein